MSPLRYGIFQLGQIWTVTDDRGARLGFPSREIAIAAASVIVAAHQAARETVLVTVQDEQGGLRTVANPVDALLGAKALKSPPLLFATANHNEA